MANTSRHILLNPGPATTSDRVKKSLLVPDICPRENEFSILINEIRDELVKVVHGNPEEYTSVMFGGSGTAVMEAVICSAIKPGAKLAVAVNGAYGERICKIAEIYKIPLVKVDFPWDKPVLISKLEEHIKNDKEIKYLAMIHHETTTGILNPLSEFMDICNKYDLISVVDAISSYAGIPINIAELKTDFLLSTSNKCIQGMPGISFAVCKRSSLENIKDYPPRSLYLNLYKQFENFENSGQFSFTPPVQIVYALKEAINEYFSEGEIARYKRYTENWKVLRRGLISLGFEILTDEKDESHILVTVLEPNSQNFDFTQMHDFLYERGFTVYPGKVANTKTFRLANMGDIYPDDIKAFLINLQEYLDKYVK